MTSPRRTIAYIDGFNLYHALRGLNRPHLKWLNLWALSESLLQPQDTLVGVNYYTAYANWLPPKSIVAHRAYIKALQAEGVTPIFGQFKDKRIKCKKCHQRFKAKEEKETDINMALGLVVDGLQDRYDKAILVSADTDLAAAVNKARELSPDKRIFVAVPPGRYALSRDLGKRFPITPGRVAKNLLASSYSDSEGNLIVSRPPRYAPPQ